MCHFMQHRFWSYLSFSALALFTVYTPAIIKAMAAALNMQRCACNVLLFFIKFAPGFLRAKFRKPLLFLQGKTLITLFVFLAPLLYFNSQKQIIFTFVIKMGDALTLTSKRSKC